MENASSPVINSLSHVFSNFSKLVFFSVFFFALIIVLSSFLGLVWLNSAFIILASFAGAFLIYKKYYYHGFFISGKIVLLSILLVMMLSYPVLTITPFFPASADAITTTAVRVIADKIPFDFQPYSELNFGYQIGFPLLVNAFAETFPFLPDYLWSWALGIMAGVLQLCGVYFVAKSFFKSEHIAWYASLLFLGTKLVFENLYVGEYAWLLATAFLLFTLYFALEKKNLLLLTFPVIFILHPAVGLNAVVLFAVLHFFHTKLPYLKEAFASLLLVLPAIYFTYLPGIYNVLFMRIPGGGDAPGPIYYLTVLPPWLGIVPFLLAILGVAYFFLKKEKAQKELLFLLLLFCAGFALYMLFGVLGIIISGRVVEVMVLPVVLFSAWFISEISGFKFFENKIFENKKAMLSLAILLLCFVFFFSSSILNHYRGGSKITMEEAQFSEKFRAFDPSLEKTLFLSPNPGKMAEFSNKVPFNLYSAHTLSHVSMFYYDQNKFSELDESKAKWDKILETQCVECIPETGAYYIVVKKDFFTAPINLPEVTEVFSYGNFTVYKNNPALIG